MKTALHDQINRCLSVMQNRIDGVSPVYEATTDVEFVPVGTNNYSRARAFYALQQNRVDPHIKGWSA